MERFPGDRTGNLTIVSEQIHELEKKIRTLKAHLVVSTIRNYEGKNNDQNYASMKEDVREIGKVLQVIKNNVDLLYFAEPFK